MYKLLLLYDNYLISLPNRLTAIIVVIRLILADN